MARHNHLPIFRDAYTLTLLIFTAVDKLPKKDKYTLGESLKSISLKILDDIIIINCTEDKEEKRLAFQRMDLDLQRMIIFARISYDLRLINVKKYEQIARLCDTIEKQLSGWEKWFQTAGKPVPGTSENSLF